LLSNKNDITSTDNGTVQRTTAYLYDTYGNVIQTTQSTSRSAQEKEIATTLYAKDMVDAGRDPGGTYAAMVTNNLVNIPIEVKKV